MLEKLNYVDARELLVCPLNRPGFLVEEIIPNGVHMLCGDEKTGKSWMMLDLCISVAEGTEFLGYPAQQGEVAYFCLEDTLERMQDRLFQMTDEIKGKLRLIFKANTLMNGLCDQIHLYLEDHPMTKLIVIDTFQWIRDSAKDCSYAGDYTDVAALKELALERGVTIVLIHHVKKKEDSRSVFNNASGTKGLVGAVDTTYILSKESDESDRATLYARGRDLIYTEMIIRFRNCRWELIERKTQEQLRKEKTPPVLFQLVDFIKSVQHWEGTATEMLATLGETGLAPNVFSKYVNQYRLSLLLDEGIEYKYHKTREKRLMSFQFCGDGDDGDGDSDSCA